MSGAYGGQSSLWTLVIIVAVVVIRLLRSRGTQQVNPVMLVIMTLLIMYATYALVAFSGATPGVASGPATNGVRAGVKAAAIPYYAIGAILGLALGVVRARMVSMFRDPATGKIMQKSSALTLLIWVVLFAIRFAIRYLASLGLVGSYAEPVSDALLLIGTGSIIGRNVYLLARYAQLSGVAFAR